MFGKKQDKKLYIDFDGVIVDTITPSYAMLEERGISRSDIPLVRKFYRELNWEEFLKECSVIEGSMEAIQKLLSKNIDVSILTHVNSLEELIAKVKVLEDNIANSMELDIIGVPREISKEKMMNSKGNVLVDDYAGNLRAWENAGGIGIKFAKEDEGEFKTIDNLLDLLDISI